MLINELIFNIVFNKIVLGKNMFMCIDSLSYLAMLLHGCTVQMQKSRWDMQVRCKYVKFDNGSTFFKQVDVGKM